MALIKTVTNGDRTAEFKAVSLNHVMGIVFCLVSIIGAQQTWLWAGAHEREMIVATIRLQIVSDIDRHANGDNARFSTIERKLEHIEAGLDETLKQMNKNTGLIEANKERRNSP